MRIEKVRGVRRRRKRVLTVLLCAGGEVGGRCCQHHSPCFLGDVDQQVVNLLEIEVCHCAVCCERMRIRDVK